jgi:thioredoxin reductase (NADPH)
MTGSELLDEARHLHPQAKRGLVIPWGGWGDRATGEASFDLDCPWSHRPLTVQPSASPDELFHQAISSLLLEWAEARRASPYTIHIRAPAIADSACRRSRR